MLRWTGLGFLIYVFSCAAVPAAYFVTEATYRLTGTRNVQLALLAVAVLMLGFAVVVWRVGTLLNAKGAGHTVMGAPMQKGAGFFLILAWLLPCIALGQVTTSVLGWVAFFLPVVVLFGVEVVKQRRAMRAGGGPSASGPRTEV